MSDSCIEKDYLLKILVDLLNIPSPSGYSDQVVHYVGQELQRLGIAFNVTRRGAIRATLPGSADSHDRAIAAHLDTLGAMVKEVLPNGRLSIVPVGTWPSRFAEGARVTVFCDSGPLRGTVLPQKASGHIFGDLVDSQPSGWEHLELRVDAGRDLSPERLKERAAPGDFVAFDAVPEITPNGYINARHLDDKAGVAILLAVARSIVKHQIELPVDCHLIFTIFEEVGSGASSAVYGDVAEMVVIDNAPVGPGQNAIENGVTIAMMDLAGPFDYHLSRKLLRLCRQHDIVYARDVFRHYRSDSASAIEAGNDTRTALAGFGVDASHGYERTHLSSLIAVARLSESFIQSKPTFDRDKDDLTSLTGFPHQPVREIIKIRT